MNERLMLRMTDGTQYQICQAGMDGPVTLVFGDGPAYRRTFPTMRRALFCLGGMVAWDAWDAPTQTNLRAHNDGQPV
jgi:hypothetical protein